MKALNKRNSKIFTYISIITLIVIVTSSLYLFYSYINGKYVSDFLTHIETALSGRAGYSFAHLIIKICYFFDNKGITLTIFMGVIVVFTLLLIYEYIKSFLADYFNNSVALLVSCTVLFTSNIYFPVFFPHFYDHYTIVSQPLHNITFLLMRMWSVAVVYLWIKILKCIQSNEAIKIKDTFLFCILLLLCNYSKPNFILAFGPVVGVTSVFYLLKYKFSNILSVMQLGLAGLISIAPLFIQTQIVFAEEENSSIALSAENFLDYLQGGVEGSFLVYEASNLFFPLFVVISLLFLRLFRRVDIDFSRLIQGCSLFIVAHLQQLFMIETGHRKSHGNFAWGVYGAGMLLFMIIITEWIYLYGNKKIGKRLFWIGNVIYMCHIATGIVYYCKLLLGQGYVI